MQNKCKELEERIKDGTLKKSHDKSEKIELMKLNSYPKNKLPDVSVSKIHVDKDNNCVLVPVNGRLFPINVACIKNVTRHTDKKFTALRFNLQTPSSFSGNIEFPL